MGRGAGEVRVRLEGPSIRDSGSGKVGGSRWGEAPDPLPQQGWSRSRHTTAWVWVRLCAQHLTCIQPYLILAFHHSAHFVEGKADSARGQIPPNGGTGRILTFDFQQIRNYLLV